MHAHCYINRQSKDDSLSAGRHCMSPDCSGFCKHNSPSFAAWHRPYVWTFEQGLMKHAANVVEGLKTPQLREQYGEILPTIRLPYWCVMTN